MMILRQRPAIAMIELIFAIVIMGIVMMSAPQMISTASQSGYTAIQQEGISEAATQANIMLGYQWDENDTNESHSTVLNVAGGDNALDGNAIQPKRRAGTPASSHRIYKSYDGEEFDASAIGGDAIAGVAEPEIDDIDDFNNTAVNLQLQGLASTSDYIEKGANINISRTVTYMDDTAANYLTGGGGILSFTPDFATNGATTNIKRVQVTLTSTSGVDELNKTITLHAFSCNIGSYKLEER